MESLFSLPAKVDTILSKDEKLEFRVPMRCDKNPAFYITKPLSYIMNDTLLACTPDTVLEKLPKVNSGIFTRNNSEAYDLKVQILDDRVWEAAKKLESHVSTQATEWTGCLRDLDMEAGTSKRRKKDDTEKPLAIRSCLIESNDWGRQFKVRITKPKHEEAPLFFSCRIDKSTQTPDYSAKMKLSFKQGIDLIKSNRGMNILPLLDFSHVIIDRKGFFNLVFYLKAGILFPETGVVGSEEDTASALSDPFLGILFTDSVTNATQVDHE